MSVRIQLDRADAFHFTNLDLVKGRVILILHSDSNISAITVKLEGESKTRLAGPKASYNDRPDRKPRIELEVHKVLYQVLTVFPNPELQQASTNSQYTLSPGTYEYPFEFKIPFNNACMNSGSSLKDLKLGALNLSFAPDTNKHVKKALPPSLSGLPGQAEIKYYVKATVVRPKFYQGNLRILSDFKFLPIEPPGRPIDRHEEVFARRKQQFQKPTMLQPKKGLFRRTSAVDSTDEEPLAFQVDSRLPSPPVIICNEPLPLRILVQKLNQNDARVYLGLLQIDLIAFTRVRAHDLTRTETFSWQLTSQPNLNILLGNSDELNPKELIIPSRLWSNIPLPNTVAPSFETCNISRRYELDIRIGLTHGTPNGVQPELLMSPLRMPVKIFSGIIPPPQLLQAMSAPNRPGRASSMVSTGNGRPQGSFQTPSSPSQDSGLFAPQVGSFASPQDLDPADAPPSYEDAMAESLGPVDGPRREYEVSSDPDSPGMAFNSDAKREGLGRRVSERLFPSNAPNFPRSSTLSPYQSMTEPRPGDGA